MRLPPLPTITEIIKLYRLSAKAQLSQNFLLDMNLTDKMVRCAGDLSDKFACEVGCGPGSLTRSILHAGVKQVVGVEKDHRFIPSLELLANASNGRFIVKHDDILKFDIEAAFPLVQKRAWEDDSQLCLIGNLPFNVSIPLLLQWLRAMPIRHGPFSFGRSTMTLTFQKEVAERITAPPNHSQRSRLSVMVQHLCDVKWVFDLPSSVFVPRPKVNAAVLHFVPLVVPVLDVPFDILEIVVKSVFNFRRKIISKGARLLFPESPDLVSNLFSMSDINPQLRAQQLTLEQWGRLCTAYAQLRKDLM